MPLPVSHDEYLYFSLISLSLTACLASVLNLFIDDKPGSGGLSSHHSEKLIESE
jgi:hypothetical protein